MTLMPLRAPICRVAALLAALLFTGAAFAQSDELADALMARPEDGDFPLMLFDGLRTDFSLARLRHYTGAPAEHVQPYILFMERQLAER